MASRYFMVVVVVVVQYSFATVSRVMGSRGSSWGEW